MTFIKPQQLYAAIDTVRGDRSMRAVAREIGCSPSTLTRLADGHSPAAKTYCNLLAWLIEQHPLAEPPCPHAHVFWTSGVGTVMEPPQPRRLCLDCGVKL